MLSMEMASFLLKIHLKLEVAGLRGRNIALRSVNVLPEKMISASLSFNPFKMGISRYDGEGSAE